MRTLLIALGLSLTFTANAGLEENCRAGAQFAHDVAVSRTNGQSKETLAKYIVNNYEGKNATIRLGVVEIVYNMSYEQVKNDEAVRALFFQSCMEKNSTGS